MKKNFKTSELAHIWAAQTQSEGKAGSFYFRDKTIYSYGSHFPIATIIDNTVLFTKKSYSNSTAKHISKTRAAISHLPKIYCYSVPTYGVKDSFAHSENLNQWLIAINVLKNELGNKRNKPTPRLSLISDLLHEANVYTSFFEIPLSKALKNVKKEFSSENFIESIQKQKEIEDAKLARKLKTSEKHYQKYLSMWRKFDTEGIQCLGDSEKSLINLYTNHMGAKTNLRYNAAKKRVETSKGVEIPYTIAVQTFSALKDCLNSVCDSINIQVMDYTITKTTKTDIVAGCHTIPKEDVLYIANLLGLISKAQ